MFPASITVATYSCPRMLPGVAGWPGGTERMCRSVPQMLPRSTLSNTSSSARTLGTATLSTAHLPSPRKTTACIVALMNLLDDALPENALALDGFLVVLPGCLNGCFFRDFCYGDIPPGFVTGDACFFVGFNDDDRRFLPGFSVLQSLNQVVSRNRANGMRTEAACAGHKIHREHLAIEL